MAPQQYSRAMETQALSQSASQHDGLMLHTMEQHEPSSQPGLPCVSKQLPRHGQVQPLLAGTLHSSRAVLTHVLSHSPWQHDGSAAHTPLQQDESRQPGFSCEAKQSPSAGQPSGAGQTAVATSTHP